METTDGTPAAILRLEGTFDLPSARLVEYSLKRLSPGDRVLIDFTRVQRFHDYGIAVLAQALARSGTLDVKLEGLGTHHVRLLRYFGISSDVFRPPRRERDRRDV